MTMLERLSLVLVAVFLTACASGVTKMEHGTSVPATVSPNVSTVRVHLSADAKKLLADNEIFNQETLQLTIEKALKGNNLQQAGSSQTLDIEITGFRVRSAVAAVMFGLLAGNDNVEGIVSIKDANGVILKKSKVTASYALGGFGGGQNDARMGWLYEEFAKHVVAEISGVPAK